MADPQSLTGIDELKVQTYSTSYEMTHPYVSLYKSVRELFIKSLYLASVYIFSIFFTY